MFRFKLHIDKLIALTNFTSLGFTNAVDIENCSVDGIIGFYLLGIEYSNNQTSCLFMYTTESDTYSSTLVGNQIKSISSTETYITFRANLPENYIMKQAILYYISTGIVEVLQDEDVSDISLVVYLQNSENDDLIKSLTTIDLINGKFNHAIGLKNINIDVVNYSLNYNYVFIPKFNRYYYIDSIEIISADISRLHLKEDVLMSWKTLIKLQKAFISRYENSDSLSIIDEREPFSDIQYVSYDTFNITSQDNKVNASFDFNLSQYKRNFLITTIVNQGVVSTGYYNDAKITAFDNALPDIQPHEIPQYRMYLMSPNRIGTFIDAILNDDTTASYLVSVLWLPFDPADVFNANTDDDYTTPKTDNLYIGTKQLMIDAGNNHFVNYTQGLSALEKPQCTSETNDHHKLMQIPYIVIFDGKYSVSNIDDAFFYPPHSYYEIHIPFVGFVQLQPKDFFNQRIIIYYSLDAKSGTSTCYIYNYDKQMCIWSGTCQLGFKATISTSNTLENTKQKQSAELNMLMGLLASAVSIGVGVASENPVAIVGGVLSAGKTIASNVNANRMIFERTSTNYGTSDGALFDVYDVFLKITYHRRINDTTETINVYKHMQGKPYNKYLENMNSLSGYVEIGEIHFDPKGESIYQDEISEIVDLLQKGVIF